MFLSWCGKQIRESVITYPSCGVLQAVSDRTPDTNNHTTPPYFTSYILKNLENFNENKNIISRNTFSFSWMQ